MKRLQINRSPHSVHQLYVHLVFVAKARRKFLNPGKIEDYSKLFSSICELIGSKLVSDPKRAKGLCELVQFGLEADHVHLLVRYPPTISMSELVQYLKGLSSKNWPDRGTPAGQGCDVRNAKEPLWTSSYFAKSVGHKSLQETVDYAENQGQKSVKTSSSGSSPIWHDGHAHNPLTNGTHAAAR